MERMTRDDRRPDNLTDATRGWFLRYPDDSTGWLAGFGFVSDWLAWLRWFGFAVIGLITTRRWEPRRATRSRGQG